MADTNGLVLGIEIDGEGCHPAAWRRAAHPPTTLFDPRRLVRLAETAERAGFAFLTLDDDIVPPGSQPDVVGRIGSVERAAYVSAALSVLSVVPVLSTTYSEPFHVSSQLASIDHLTAGRSGWVATVTGDPDAASAWGRPAVSGAARLRQEAADAALAAVTERIGLVSTSNVTYNEPADLARRLAGLDLLSGGRAGWNVVTTDNAWTGENFRRGGYLDHADRYRRAEQVLRAARAIWDGWADDALGAGADAPSWLRPGSVTPAQVRDDLVDIEVTPRSAQGHPVIFQAGDSGEGRDFAAGNADVIFSAHGTDFDDALAFAQDIRSRLRGAGRPEDDLRILPGTQIVIGATESEAQEKAAWVRSQQITPRTALAMAGLLWNRDLSDRDPEGPLPPEGPNEPDQSGAFGAARFSDAVETVARWRQAAEANGWSLRETVIHVGRRAGGHVGTPSGLADKFAHFVRHGAVDGFNVSPYIVPHGLDDIVDLLVPALQERGVYPAEYQGSTLREHLGLRAARSGASAAERRRAG